MRLRLGTRRSKLALAQAAEVEARLRALGAEVEIVPLVTSGDRGATASAGAAGLKGLFVHEIVLALQRGEIDVAVHSAKDLPAEDPSGVVVGAVPERASPLDVLITRAPQLMPGGMVGTGSLRRRAQLIRLRPDVRVTDLRGNVDTRLRRMEEGVVDAVVLAAAGLSRLGLSPSNVRVLAVDDMVPAPGQGALAIQVRAEGGPAAEMVKLLDHAPSRAAFESERAVMGLLGGGCDLPLGAFAEETSVGIRMIAVVVRPDGSGLVRAEATDSTPGAVARAVAGSLLEQGAGDILLDAGR